MKRTLSFVLSVLCLGTPGVVLAQAAEEDAEEPSVESAGAEEADEDEAVPTLTVKPKRQVARIGMAADATLVGGQTAGVEGGGDGTWKFNFKGFMRAPMRLSHGTLGGETQFHSPPVVPDANFTNWQYTNNLPGPWVEMLFQYGNDKVKMTTALASYNITSGGYRELQAQLGIDRAFLTLNFPEALSELGGLSWNVGVFSDAYGSAGRYDAGMYQTFLFGKTRIAGETLRANLFVGDDFTLLVDHGFGSKTDQQHWTDRAVAAAPGDSYQAYEPYPGPQQQGSTLLHHAHLALVYKDLLTTTLHYMDTWTRDQRATAGQKDGKIQIVGVDTKFSGGWMGEGYIGVSQINAANAVAVSDSIEVLHSQGGWQLANNYLGSDGNGKVTSVLFQYRFSLAAFMLRPQEWWGDGTDLVVHLFGMYNKVDSGKDVPLNGPGNQKLKFGADAIYTPLPVLGFGGRFDLVQPDLDNSRRSFAVLTPRIVLKSNYVTHEEVSIMYARYFNKSETMLPFPFGGQGAPYPAPGPDDGVFMVQATMWW